MLEACLESVWMLTLRFLARVKALWEFPGGSDGKVSVYNAGDLGSIPGLGSSLEKEMATHSRVLPRKSHGQRSLVSMGSQRVGHD